MKRIVIKNVIVLVSVILSSYVYWFAAIDLSSTISSSIFFGFILGIIYMTTLIIAVKCIPCLYNDILMA